VKGNHIREVVYVGRGGMPYEYLVVWADRKTVGVCSVHNIVKWADYEMPRPKEWVRPHADVITQFENLGLLPFPPADWKPHINFDKARSELAKAIVLQGLRNTELENIHAGTWPSTKTGDYEDVKVVSPYGEIPWNELSRISQEEMKDLMIKAVNRVYTILSLPDFRHSGIFTGKWNEAEPDDDFMRFAAMVGVFGEKEKLLAEEAMRDKNIKMALKMSSKEGAGESAE
jgi:hypothetical protein